MEKKIQELIKKYEDKIEAVKNLISPPISRSFGDTLSLSDEQRLKARLYERKCFVEDLKSLLTNEH